SVLASHPIIRELGDMRDRKLHLAGNFTGSIGELRDATPLLVAPGVDNRHPTDAPPDTPFYPLYVARLGRGRVVCLQWNNAQDEFVALTAGRFYVRCVQWAANHL